MITVKLPSLLHKELGEEEYTSKARTVGELLEELANRYGSEIISRYQRHFAGFVNGRDSRELKGEKTKLRKGDTVQIYLVIAGG